MLFIYLFVSRVAVNSIALKVTPDQLLSLNDWLGPLDWQKKSCDISIFLPIWYSKTVNMNSTCNIWNVIRDFLTGYLRTSIFESIYMNENQNRNQKWKNTLMLALKLTVFIICSNAHAFQKNSILTDIDPTNETIVYKRSGLGNLLVQDIVQDYYETNPTLKEILGMSDYEFWFKFMEILIWLKSEYFKNVINICW